MWTKLLHDLRCCSLTTYVDKASCLTALSVIWSSSEADKSWYWPNMCSAVNGIHLCHSPLTKNVVYIMSCLLSAIVLWLGHI